MDEGLKADKKSQHNAMMDIIYAADHAGHDPEHFLVHGRIRPNPEVPARAERIIEAVTAAGRTVMAPPAYGTAPAAAVHTPEYLQFLATIHARWQTLEGAAAEVIPHIHPSRHGDARPASAAGLAGYHMGDTSCPIGAGTWHAARRSADSAVCAADRVADGTQAIYALCRPPGHHAYADLAGGFCFLNNSAIAAQRLRRRMDRVTILDVDVHHGNGTQAIFWRRRDVLTLSVHADPAHFYPFFWGHAHEQGEGEGKGYNLNFPLAIGSSDDALLQQVEAALTVLRSYAPGALVVALGLDAFEGDPLSGLKITTSGFRRIGAAIAAAGYPTLLVQEGGYLTPELGANLLSFLSGFEKSEQHRS